MSPFQRQGSIREDRIVDSSSQPWPRTTTSLQEHIQAIAKILYEDTSAEQLTTLAGIEQAVRNQMQKHVMPEVGVFCHSSYRHKRRTPAHPQKHSWRTASNKPTSPTLRVRSHTTSPYLELCCLRVSANVSYQHAEEDVELFTGIQVAAKTSSG